MKNEIIKLVKWDDRLYEPQIHELLKKRHLQLPLLREIVKLPYSEYGDYLWALSRSKLTYAADATTGILEEDGKKTEIPIPAKAGRYELDPNTGFPNGKPTSDLTNSAYFSRRYGEAWSGLLACGDDSLGRRGVVAYYFPGLRFGVLATQLGKRKEEKDPTLDWLKAKAKKNKNAKNILRRLKEAENV